MQKDFHKYRRLGAYHWRDADLSSLRNYNPVVAARYTTALKLIPKEAQQILDVGCGDGYLLHRLALAGRETWGIDLSLEGLRAGRREYARRESAYHHRPPLTAQGSAYQLPFEDTSFDCVLLTEMIEHVSDPARVLQETKRVLRPRGVVVISTPCRQGRHMRDPLHFCEYSPEELQQMVAKHFRITVIYGLGWIKLLRLHKRFVVNSYWRQMIHRLCRWHLNPFERPLKKASSASNLLFAICKSAKN
jgi:2-polyprenyl-3-methyl-5-hydroxy-6-metoxy-1,4-benzoquinol methylase